MRSNTNTTAAFTRSALLADRTVLLVPSLNGGERWIEFITALAEQQAPGLRSVVIDSESSDGTAEQAQRAGLHVQRIARKTFNHGSTRQLALEQHAQGAEIVIFMTQDAVLADPHAISRLLSAFDNPKVAAAYGRQLPHHEATPVAAHARLFSYPDQSETRSIQDVARLGLKTCYLSNAFAAYRLSALRAVGGFADDLILGEDMHLAARLLQAGQAIRYQADACVRHSHNYSLIAEFQRYFDTGVFHAQQPWLTTEFGGAGREGMKFLLSEIAYLLRHAPWRLPEAGCRTILKALAYRLGLGYARMPRALLRPLSMHKAYWT